VVISKPSKLVGTCGDEPYEPCEKSAAIALFCAVFGHRALRWRQTRENIAVGTLKLSGGDDQTGLHWRRFVQGFVSALGLMPEGKVRGCHADGMSLVNTYTVNLNLQPSFLNKRGEGEG